MPNRYNPYKKTIAELLSNTSPPVVVPDWQRNYSWTTSEVETFWRDLVAFSERYPAENINEEEYFLGSVVIVATDNKHLVLDGQQRLASSAILLSVIRDYLQRYNTDAATRLQSRYLQDYDDARNQQLDRITLNAYDREFFSREILKLRDSDYVPPAEKYESHKRIRRARNYFSQKFEELYLSRSPKQAHEWALRVSLVLTQHMSVVAVISTDEDNASEVFETLNDRGIGLSTPDLLRNLILRRAPEDSRELIVSLWQDILALESDADSKTFIRHFWISLMGDVKSQSLYRAMKSHIQENGIDSLRFTEYVYDAAIAYKSIVTGQDDDEEIGRLLVDIRELGANVLYPIVLSTFATYPDVARRRRILKSLVATYVRHTLICQKENSRLESGVYGLAKQMREEKPPEEHVRALLQGIAPADDEFQLAFRAVSVSRRASARYLLKELALHPNSDAEIVQSALKVHVEHIYPQRPPTERKWANHDEMIDRLGNLTLLSKGLNIGARNGTITQKAQFYAKSTVPMTKALATLADWTVADIDARQALFANNAPDVWRV